MRMDGRLRHRVQDRVAAVAALLLLSAGCGATSRTHCPPGCPCCTAEPVSASCPSAGDGEALDQATEAAVDALPGSGDSAAGDGVPPAASEARVTLASGWSYALEEIAAGLDVTSFRWLEGGELLFGSSDGWEIWNGEEARALEGDELKKTLKAGKPPWEKKGKWRVYFQIYAAGGGDACEDLAGRIAARIEVCLRKKEDLCNVHTFVEGMDEQFPWSAAEVPSETEALDLILFKGNDRLVIARKGFAALLTMSGEPPPLVEGGSVPGDPADECDGLLPGEPRGNFAGVEVLDDLSAFIGGLQGTAYTQDGRGYVYGKPGGLWLATFMDGDEDALLVEFPGDPVSVAWAPDGGKMAVLDSEQRLFVARVEPPDEPPLVTVDEGAVVE